MPVGRVICPTLQKEFFLILLKRLTSTTETFEQKFQKADECKLPLPFCEEKPACIVLVRPGRGGMEIGA